MNSTPITKPTFEESYDTILTLVRRRRAKWYYPVNWMDFDDVEMMIVAHINKKWEQYNPELPLANWVNRTVSNQFKNILRNSTRNNLFSYECVDEDFRNTNADQQVLHFDSSIELLKVQSKNLLTPTEYKVFIDLFFNKIPEEKIIKYLGYKIIYKGGKAYNKTFNTLVKRIYDKIKKGFESDGLDMSLS